ncbi:MAG: ParA family protein [Comamonadaceae bacterium]|nr:ParA family protein [Comamonadaceae bacterium]
MPVIVVANPKGGVGKSTLATHVAGYWAARGHAVMLGDVDRQQSSRLWLSLRPPQARPIAAWEVSRDFIVRPPKGTTHVVLDTPAGLDGYRLKDLMRLADKVLVPLAPSIFDIYATREFLDQLNTLRGAAKAEVGIVGMRVDERTIAASQWRQFADSLGLPVLAALRPTQNYVYLAARGLTLFDLTPGRVARDLAQWEGICQWLDARPGA